MPELKRTHLARNRENRNDREKMLKKIMSIYRSKKGLITVDEIRAKPNKTITTNKMFYKLFIKWY